MFHLTEKAYWPKRSFLSRGSGLICFLLFAFLVSRSQQLPLPAEWKFSLGDNMDWASPTFNDSAWHTKKIGQIFSVTDRKEVYAWYRTRIAIPSTLKEKARKCNGIRLNLGEIYEVDEAFFNGTMIGHTGAFPPAYKEIKNRDRAYFIPLEAIHWDEENLVAVRLFSNDIRESGMHQGPYYFSPIKWPDFIAIKNEVIPLAGQHFSTRVGLVNKSDHAFTGIINYRVSDLNGQILSSFSKPVSVNGEENAHQEFDFPFTGSSEEKMFRINYEVKETDGNEVVNNEQLYLANKNIDLPVEKEPQPVVQNKVADVFIPARLQEQSFQGYLGKRLQLNLEERLLKIDEQGIIAGYLKRPGSHAWIGEHVGKYLETACNTWKYTHDVRLKKQMDRLVYELIHSQLKDGYLGTYPPDQYWTSWDVWSHKYNLYGLIAYYATTGYKPALQACKRIGDMLCDTFGYKPGQRDIIAAGTHVGMAATSILDPMLDLYRYTGNKKYLAFCYYILQAQEQSNGPHIVSGLLATKQVNKVANAKAYEMISNLLGLVNMYRVTGERKWLDPALIAWKDIVNNRLYITGTASSLEHFQADGVLPAATKDRMGEGCVTTTWIQFNQSLLEISGELKYLAEIERSVYNQLLGAENPETGCVSYYTALMDPKPYSCEITCCTSSVPRGIALIPYSSFGMVKNTPAFLLYEAGSFKDKLSVPGKSDIDIAFTVQTNFPAEGEIDITVATSKSAKFPVAFRVPSWCENFTATCKGKVYKGNASHYLFIARNWKTGDQVKLSFQMPFRPINGGLSYPNQVAFSRGPQVLAFDSTLNKMQLPKDLSLAGRPLKIDLKNPASPVALPSQWIGRQSYSFRLPANDQAAQQLVLVPFADASQTGGNIKVWLPVQSMP